MRSLLLLVTAASLALGGCTTADVGSTPRLPADVVAIAQTGIDATANAFDAALYGLDFAMDVNMLAPGSDSAKRIAAIGRKVQGFLNAADSALKAGNAGTAKAALDNANAAISEFRALLPAHRVTGMASPPLGSRGRAEILARAAA